jgi:hypothetical protein
MPEPTVALEAFRQLVGRPDETFPDLLGAMTDAAAWPGVVAQQIADFAERVRDLSLDELQELHDETFATAPLPRVQTARRDIAAAAAARHQAWEILSAWFGSLTPSQFAAGACPDAVLTALAGLQGGLVTARNPYHHVMAALYGYLTRR